MAKTWNGFALSAFVAWQLAVQANLCAQAPPRKPLKVFIAVDSEGETGFATYWAHDLRHPKYEEYRRLLMGDVNAAIEGCLAAGATEVLVSDDTATGITIPLEALHPAGRLIGGRGAGAQKLVRLHGMDETFAGVILVGTHAMEGTPDGVLAHTLTGVSEKHRRYFYNGREAGEMAVYGMVAGHYNVPVLMVTGCEAACREAREFFGSEVVGVAVKKGFNPERAILLPPRQTGEMIKRGAVEAIGRIGRIKPYKIDLPVKVRLVFPNKQFADEHQQSRLKSNKDWPGLRVDERTFETTIRSLLDRNLVL